MVIIFGVFRQTRIFESPLELIGKHLAGDESLGEFLAFHVFLMDDMRF
jgi:hypothetical protein